MLGIDAEHRTSAFGPTKAGQHSQRLLSDVAGHLVRVDDDAARTGLAQVQPHGADPKLVPPVLSPRRGPVHDQIRPKPLHGHRPLQPRVEVVEGCAIGDQEWVPVGKRQLTISSIGE